MYQHNTSCNVTQLLKMAIPCEFCKKKPYFLVRLPKSANIIMCVLFELFFMGLRFSDLKTSWFWVKPSTTGFRILENYQPQNGCLNCKVVGKLNS